MQVVDRIQKQYEEDFGDKKLFQPLVCVSVHPVLAIYRSYRDGKLAIFCHLIGGHVRRVQRFRSILTLLRMTKVNYIIHLGHLLVYNFILLSMLSSVLTFKFH